MSLQKKKDEPKSYSIGWELVKALGMTALAVADKYYEEKETIAKRATKVCLKQDSLVINIYFFHREGNPEVLYDTVATEMGVSLAFSPVVDCVENEKYAHVALKFVFQWNGKRTTVVIAGVCSDTHNLVPEIHLTEPADVFQTVPLGEVYLAPNALLKMCENNCLNNHPYEVCDKNCYDWALEYGKLIGQNCGMKLVSYIKNLKYSQFSFFIHAADVFHVLDIANASASTSSNGRSKNNMSLFQHKYSNTYSDASSSLQLNCLSKAKVISVNDSSTQLNCTRMEAMCLRDSYTKSCSDTSSSLHSNCLSKDKLTSINDSSTRSNCSRMEKMSIKQDSYSKSYSDASSSLQSNCLNKYKLISINDSSTQLNCTRMEAMSLLKEGRASGYPKNCGDALPSTQSNCTSKGASSGGSEYTPPQIVKKRNWKKKSKSSPNSGSNASSPTQLNCTSKGQSWGVPEYSPPQNTKKRNRKKRSKKLSQ